MANAAALWRRRRRCCTALRSYRPSPCPGFLQAAHAFRSLSRAPCSVALRVCCSRDAVQAGRRALLLIKKAKSQHAYAERRTTKGGRWLTLTRLHFCLRRKCGTRRRICAMSCSRQTRHRVGRWAPSPLPGISWSVFLRSQVLGQPCVDDQCCSPVQRTRCAKSGTTSRVTLVRRLSRRSARPSNHLILHYHLLFSRCAWTALLRRSVPFFRVPAFLTRRSSKW